MTWLVRKGLSSSHLQHLRLGHPQVVYDLLGHAVHGVHGGDGLVAQEAESRDAEERVEGVWEVARAVRDPAGLGVLRGQDEAAHAVAVEPVEAA